MKNKPYRANYCMGPYFAVPSGRSHIGASIGVLAQINNMEIFHNYKVDSLKHGLLVFALFLKGCREGWTNYAEQSECIISGTEDYTVCPLGGRTYSIGQLDNSVEIIFHDCEYCFIKLLQGVSYKLCKCERILLQAKVGQIAGDVIKILCRHQIQMN